LLLLLLFLLLLLLLSLAGRFGGAAALASFITDGRANRSPASIGAIYRRHLSATIHVRRHSWILHRLRYVLRELADDIPTRMITGDDDAGAVALRHTYPHLTRALPNDLREMTCNTEDKDNDAVKGERRAEPRLAPH
jgi:hypothetical protein